VLPLKNITREEALERWAEAFSRAGVKGSDTEQILTRAKERLRSELDLNIDLRKPQILRPDNVGIYLASVAALTDASSAQETTAASVSAWSLILNYRLGIAAYENNAGPERLPRLLDEVQNTLLSLDRLSKSAPVP
ncbi:MAG: hypothetical protein ACRECY_12200, partial [Phyllobacterium sp.]